MTAVVPPLDALRYLHKAEPLERRLQGPGPALVPRCRRHRGAELPGPPRAGQRHARRPRLERQLFYAHLYLGLWYEAKKDFKLRDKYIGLAAAVADRHGYMGDVARVHAVLNKIKLPKPAAGK